MAKFQYIAVNQQNKTLKGTIESQDETAARAELNNIGLSVMEITETSQKMTQPNPSQVIFHFVAKDKIGKKVIGTIKGQDEISIYKRLSEEYGFDVESLENESAGVKTSLDINTIKEQAGKLNLDEIQTTNTAGQMQAKRPIEIQVEKVVNEVQENLKKLDDKLKPEAKKLIRDQINKLLLIKSSTNEDYIKESCKKVLSTIQNEESFISKDKDADLRNKMAIKSQKLFYDMKRSENKLTESITQNLISKIRNMGASKKGEEKSLIKKIISDISEKLSTIFTSTPEETAQKQIISAINSQIWDYYKLWFKSAKEGKKEFKYLN